MAITDKGRKVVPDDLPKISSALTRRSSTIP
jgi:hypothetical protein